jgi:hypothetical protein
MTTTSTKLQKDLSRSAVIPEHRDLYIDLDP